MACGKGAGAAAGAPHTAARGDVGGAAEGRWRGEALPLPLLLLLLPVLLPGRAHSGGGGGAAADAAIS